MEAEFGNMKRTDLQRCAKNAGIRANMKTEGLIKALLEYHSREADGGNKEQPHPAEETPVEWEAETKTAELAMRTSSSETSEDEAKPSRVREGGKKGRGRKKVNQKKQATVPTEVTNIAEPDIQVDTCAPEEQVEQKKTTPAGMKQKSRESNRKTPPAEPDVEVDIGQPENQEEQKKATPVVTKKQGRKSKRKTPPLAKTTKSAPKRGHSDTEDVALPLAKQQKVSPPSKAKEATPGKRSSTRKRTFSMSPPKLEMKGTAELNLLKEGNKENTPTVTQRRKPKVKRSASLRSTAKKGTPKQTPQKSLLKKSTVSAIKTGIPLPKVKTSETTAVTPGKSINLKRAHQKQFQQLESIDDYLERKRKRIEALTQSYKKKKPTSAKKTPTQRKTMSQQKTPSQRHSPAQWKTPPTPKNLKPVNKVSKRTSFFSPKPDPVVKQTASVTRTVKFQTSKLKTPVRRATVVFGKTSTERRVATPGARKSVAVMNVSANLSSFSLNSTTPFKFGNTSAVSSLAVTPAKSKFDLKASLEKALSYKPYTGKLKPLTEVKPSNVKKPVSNVTKAKETLKKPKLASRAERQKAASKHRMSSRSNNVMARRGLV